jgi:hypothetical protein
LPQQIDALDARVTENFEKFELKIAELENACKAANSNTFVAFYAQMNVTKQYQDHESIQFSRVLINYGEHYHRNNGSFICPVNGIYMFTYTILSEIYANFNINLFIDDDLVTSSLGFRPFNATYNDKIENIAIVQCESYQSVQLKIKYINPPGLNSYLIQYKSSFSGTLLHAM